MQNFTSANTSINSAKVPAVFSKAPFDAGTFNLDLGGGRFDTATEYLLERGVINMIYDPYNRTKEHNDCVMVCLKAAGGADSCTISNVLNVIDDDEARLEVLDLARYCLKPDGVCYITVYEGDRSSIGKQTGKDQWQNNKPLKGYLQEAKTVFPKAYIKNGMIIATK